jgi:hypothetical protein
LRRLEISISALHHASDVAPQQIAQGKRLVNASLACHPSIPGWDADTKAPDLNETNKSFAGLPTTWPPEYGLASTRPAGLFSLDSLQKLSTLLEIGQMLVQTLESEVQEPDHFFRPFHLGLCNVIVPIASTSQSLTPQSRQRVQTDNDIGIAGK